MQAAKDKSPMDSALKYLLVRFLFLSLREDPTRQELIPLTKPFLDSLDLAAMLKSTSTEEYDSSLNLVSLLLHHDSKLSLVELVSYDLQARDSIYRNFNSKLW